MQALIALLLALTAQGAESAEVTCLVVDVRGEPVAGVALATAGDPATSVARSDAHGVARWTSNVEQVLCAAEGQAWTTVRAAAPPHPREALLVVAPAVRVSGKVVDATGAPAGGTSVRVVFGIAELVEFPLPWTSTRAWSNSVTAKAGEFSFTAPDLEGVQVRFLRYPTARTLALRELVGRSAVVALPGPRPGVALNGIVLTPDGRPAAGARVVSDLSEAVCAADGTFTLLLASEPPGARPRPLCAGLAGHAPFVAEDVEAWLGKAGDAPVELRLPAWGASIEGRIVRVDGRPAGSWLIDLYDGTDARPGLAPRVLAEHLTRGGTGAGEPAQSALNGHFVLGGLLQRDYVLSVWSNEFNPIVLVSDPIPAGTKNFVLTIPEHPRHARLRGQVVDLDGRPLPEVRVSLALDLPLTIEGFSNSVFPPRTTTDASGHFELADVARLHSRLEFVGAGLLPTSEPMPPDAAERHVFRVPRASFLRFVDVHTTVAPDAIELRDERGQPVDLHATEMGEWIEGTQRFELQARSTPPLVTSQAARFVLAFRGDEELYRLPIELRPGEVFTATRE